MSRSRIAGAVLPVLLGARMLTRITDHRGSLPKNPASVPVRTVESQPVAETVDLTNGNIHLQIPILCHSPETDCAAIRSLNGVLAVGVSLRPGRAIRQRMRVRGALVLREQS